MQAITTIGLDIAKSVFQVHGVDAEGQVVIRRQFYNATAAVTVDLAAGTATGDASVGSDTISF